MTRLLRVAELAQRLGVSPSWVYKGTMAEELPCRCLRGILVFDESEIAAWIKAQPRRNRKKNGRPARSGPSLRESLGSSRQIEQ